MIPVLGLAPELHALEVLVGEGGSSSELHAQDEFLKWCWGSGTGALYRPERRPTDSPSSCPNWGLELWLADGLPCCVTGEYTAGRMTDIGSLCGRPNVVSGSGTVVLEGAPKLWAVQRASWLNASSILACSSLSLALLSLRCTRFLFLLGGGGAVAVALSVTVFLGTGGQISCDEFRHTELSMRVRGARTRTSLDGAIGVSVDSFLGGGYIFLGTVLEILGTESLILGTGWFTVDDGEWLDGTLGVWWGWGSWTQWRRLSCNSEVTIIIVTSEYLCLFPNDITWSFCFGYSWHSNYKIWNNHYKKKKKKIHNVFTFHCKPNYHQATLLNPLSTGYCSHSCAHPNLQGFHAQWISVFDVHLVNHETFIVNSLFDLTPSALWHIYMWHWSIETIIIQISWMFC